MGFGWKLVWDLVGEFWWADAVKGSERGVKMACLADETHSGASD